MSIITATLSNSGFSIRNRFSQSFAALRALQPEPSGSEKGLLHLSKIVLHQFYLEVVMERTKLVVVFTLLFSVPIFSMKPLLHYPCKPSDFGIMYREVAFRTEDGLGLKGWFYPAQDTAGIACDLIGKVMVVPDSMKPEVREYKPLAKKCPTIIICDGDAGNMSFAIFYAYHYFTKGYNVFTFDWRGFGESDAWNMDMNMLCCHEFLIDYHAAIDFVKAQPEVDPEKIGLMGFSTGAYLSFAMIASRNDIGAYAGRALMTSFEDLIENLQKVNPDRKFIAPDEYPENLLPVKSADRVRTPVFLIVGQNDNRTPVWMSEKVYKKLSCPKALWIVPNAEHGGQNGPEMVSYPEFFVKTLSFFDQYLK